MLLMMSDYLERLKEILQYQRYAISAADFRSPPSPLDPPHPCAKIPQSGKNSACGKFAQGKWIKPKCRTTYLPNGFSENQKAVPLNGQMLLHKQLSATTHTSSVWEIACLGLCIHSCASNGL